jgi:hypothetical protein
MAFNCSTATMKLAPHIKELHLVGFYVQMEAFKITEALRFFSSITCLLFTMTGEWVSATTESDQF